MQRIGIPPLTIQRTPNKTLHNKRENPSKIANKWLGRQDSNLGCRYQKPVPYRLATPHHEKAWSKSLRLSDERSLAKLVTACNDPFYLFHGKHVSNAKNRLKNFGTIWLAMGYFTEAHVWTPPQRDQQ
jgi:hypothetical protein